MATILVVDDRPSNRQFLTTLLGYMDHKLLEAADGAEALRLVRSARPGLVITDILMPTMDGYEFVNRMRAEPELADTPVIFYTATYSEPQARQLADSCGVRIILPKPCDPERILEAVSEALEAGGPQAAHVSAPGAARPAAPVVDAFATHLRDLQGVKVKFDDLFNRTSGTLPERERIRDLSRQFSENVGRLQDVTSRLSGLVEVGLAMNSERDPGRLVHVFFAAARDIIPSRYAAVGILDELEDSLRHVFAKDIDGAIFRADGARSGLLGSVLGERRSIRAVSAGDGPDATGLPPGHPPVRSILALPVASPDRIYGWLYFADRAGGEEFSREDERLAGIMASQLAMRYEHVMLYEVVQRHAAALQLEVTERRRVESELQRFRLAMDNSADMIFIIDRATMLYVDVNTTACTQTGYARNELLSMGPHDFITGSREEFEKDYDALVANPARKSAMSGKFRCRDGSQLPFESTRHVLRSGNTWLIAVIARDIRERLAAERELLESNSRFRQLAQNIHEVFWLTDPSKTRMLYVSPAYEKIWGRSVDSLYASPYDWVTAIHPDDRDRVLAAARTKQLSGEYDEEYRILRPDGAIRWIRDRAFPVRGGDGSVSSVTGVAEDITERKRAELDLLQLNASLELRVAERTARLEEVNRDLETFSYSVSHDLRAPLRAVNGFTEVLKQRLEGRLGDEDRRLLDRIEAGGKRMGALIEDLLKFARSGSTELRVGNADLHAIAAAVVAEVRPAYPPAHVRVRPLLPVRGDAALLREVLANLVDNAFKYSSKSARPRIEVGRLSPGEGSAYFVRDNGAGFDPAFAGNLFSPFHRLHSESEFTGTGIGLALCKRIVERHGGRIWAESTPGNGASFFFTLPEAVSPPSAPAG